MNFRTSQIHLRWRMAAFMIILLPLMQIGPHQKINVRKYIEIGKDYMSANDMSKAIDAFRVVIDLDSMQAEGRYYLGECYRLTWKFEKATEQYSWVAQNDHHGFPLAIYHLAWCQKVLGILETALANYIHFLQDRPAVDQAYFSIANHEKNGILLALDHSIIQNNRIKLKPLAAPINTTSSEYGASQFQTGHLFCIRSESENEHEFHQFKIDSGSWYMRILPVRPIRPYFPLMLDAGQFNIQKNQYYFTAKPARANAYQLWVSTVDNGTFLPPRRLEVALEGLDFDNKYPTINATEDTLYYSSNRPGGYGGYDLWFSVKNPEGQWSSPDNLGSAVNTSGNETSPFWSHEQQVLFFSSNGHLGYGNYDIYFVRYSDHDPVVINVGAPFNSGYDDVFYILAEDVGYFSTNRTGTKDNYDIYEFSLQEVTPGYEAMNDPDQK